MGNKIKELGYFRSDYLASAVNGLIRFIDNGGTAKMICGIVSNYFQRCSYFVRMDAIMNYISCWHEYYFFYCPLVETLPKM